ncbi:hypothetical protein Esti_003792 [Eimeria stiedai]
MGPLLHLASPPTEESPQSSDEEDAAEKALRFRVHTTKQRDSGEAPRLQHVVDKPIEWGPSIIPLSSLKSDSSVVAESRVERKDIQGARDCFELKGVLSESECSRLVEAAEARGFEHWGKETNGNCDDSSYTDRSMSPRVNNSYRSAHTLEMEHPDLAELIWQRVKDAVVQEVYFSEDDERFERDLQGGWRACGVNSTLLFARYTSGESFGPHTDGCVIADFNCRSLWPMVVYLNTPQGGGETTVITEEQRKKPILKDDGGRFTADPRFVVYNCAPKAGNALLFYHSQMHEGRPVAEKSVKYIIRTDIMYERKEPRFTSPADKEAFALWQEAQLFAEKGKTDAAAALFRRMTKVSPALAHFYGL